MNMEWDVSRPASMGRVLVENLATLVERNPMNILLRCARDWKLARQDRIERRAEARRNKERISILQNYFVQGAVGAELGVHKGYFSRVLLCELKPQRLYLIDPWYQLGREWSWGPGNRGTCRALSKIVMNLEEDLVAGRAVLRVGDDLEQLMHLPDGCLDWAYVDSSHAYEHTARELELLNSKVKSGGYIGGDDWRPDPRERHHGVYRAVQEFIAATDWRLAYSNDHNLQWILARS
jgi:hypothetical protein